MSRRLALLAVLVILSAGVFFLSRPDGSRSADRDEASPARSPKPAESSLTLSPSSPEGETRSIAPVQEPRSPEAALPITVWTCTGLTFDAESVPDVAFLLGLGDPWATTSPLLAAGTTDAQGRAEVAIPWPPVEASPADPDGRAWIRVASPGFQRRTRIVWLSSIHEKREIRVIAQRGGNLRVRVVDETGRPVKGSVSLNCFTPEGRWARESSLITDGFGRCELQLYREGTWNVLAEAGDSGTGIVRDHAIRFTDSPQELELHVSGPGVVRGRVRDAAGGPAAGLELCVLAAVADDAAGSFIVPDSISSALMLEGRGRYWHTTTTAADGSFEARGMRVDAFVVRARTRGGSDYPHRLTPIAVPSDGQPLDLVLDRPHLAVQVVDEEGRPFAGPLGVDTSPWPKPGDAWPEKPMVVVAPVREQAHLGDLEATYVPGRLVCTAEFAFEVEEDRRFEVGLLGGAESWRPTEVEVPKGASRVDVTLVARRAGPTGEIIVSAVGPDGAALEWGIAIRIEDPTTAMPLVADDSFYQKPWPQRFVLPRGEYRVVVEGAASSDIFHGILTSPRKYGRYETLVSVEPGRVAEVHAVVPAGARMHLILRGEVREEDRSATRGGDPSTDDSYVEYWACRPSLVLLSDGGWPEPAMFTFEITGSSAAGTHLTSTLPIGDDAISQVLPAGRFRLEGRMPGGRVAAAPIVLVDGETIEIALEFAP